MKVPGIIVARTDAEAATLLESRSDERDHPFLLGATRVNLPSCKVASLAIQKRLHDLGVKEVNGHLLYRVPESAYEEAFAWFERVGFMPSIKDAAATHASDRGSDIGAALEKLTTTLFETWQVEAGLKTYGEAVAEAMAFHSDEGLKFEMTIPEWLDWSSQVSFGEAREKARSMGVNVIWDHELPRTPEGFYPIQGGIEYAIARSLHVAPFADLVWMETKTADLADARRFADAIHARYPDQMLAYNLSPSFNWDTTGMRDDEMSRFPEELAKLGYVFSFITYGGHQVDGMAAEEFATALKQDGMLALARLQRKIRLVESPYRTPQTLVGGARLDGALMACTGRTSTTIAMGKGSTQVQHLMQTEVPPSLLAKWLEAWAREHRIPRALRVELRPHTAGSDLLGLSVLDESGKRVAGVVFATIQDRRGQTILSIRDQETFDLSLRRKRLMTLLHLFLIHRYRIASVHYVSPTDDNHRQTERMKAMGIFDQVQDEIGQIIVADVNSARIQELLASDGAELHKLIAAGSR
jgi:isocitrate lyase